MDDPLSQITSAARSLLLERFLDIQMDLTNRCNLSCPFCYQSFDQELRAHRHDMSFDLFERIARDVFPVARSVGLSCGAEPLMTSVLPEALDVIGRYGIPRVWLVTNALLLRRPIIERMIASGLHEILVSVDSVRPELYARLRKGGRLSTLRSKLQLLRDVKRERGTSLPGLRLAVILMRCNLEGLEELVDFAREMGCEGMGFQHLVPYKESGMADESLYQHKERANEYLGRLRRKLAAVKMPAEVPADFPALERCPGKPQTEGPHSGEGLHADIRDVSKCHFVNEWINIAPNGDVNPCCYWYGQAPIANLSRQPFREFWKGPDYGKLREELLARRPSRSCCRTCPMYAKTEGEVAYGKDP